MMQTLQKSVLSTDELQTIASDILKEAAKRGASHAEVGIDANKGFSVTAREGDVETIEYHQDKSIDVVVYFGQRCGATPGCKGRRAIKLNCSRD